MARPISMTMPARDPRLELQERLENAPAEHAEALLSAYEVLQGLHDKGALELLRGALGSGDHVLEIAVDGLRTPQSIRSVRNLVLMVNLLGAIDPDQLGLLTRAVPPAFTVAANVKPPGLWKLMTTILWNRDIHRALWMMTSLLATFGRSLKAPGGKP